SMTGSDSFQRGILKARPQLVPSGDRTRDQARTTADAGQNNIVRRVTSPVTASRPTTISRLPRVSPHARQHNGRMHTV
ncbi:hypothetical protein, partial [Escherichia coli]|uniref:hypothetical protein n=1 Tax=Escherichia coli TaxID=562 RepID=UPI001964E4A6